jgi:MoxR-like ATPase
LEAVSTDGSPGSSTLGEVRAKLGTEVAKVVVGQRQVLDAVVLALGTGGHVLLEGVPGTAKTLLAAAVARAVAGSFRRIQFTPDMLPSDVTGTLILERGELRFRRGPVFANVVLADEVNRTPPRTQAALLEVMQEGQVTVEGEAHRLPRPFLVLATENPIEYEGTYPLPEAQLDRFLFRITVGYPSEEEEVALLGLDRRGVASAPLDDVAAVVSGEEIARAASEVDATTVAPELARYVAQLVRRTRELPAVSVGASPRAAVHLLTAAKAAARLAGRYYALPDDVRGVATAVLAHRLVLRPEAELDRYHPADAIESALASVPVPR